MFAKLPLFRSNDLEAVRWAVALQIHQIGSRAPGTGFHGARSPVQSAKDGTIAWPADYLEVVATKQL